METYESLAALRDATESSTRTWVARQRTAGRLVTVEVQGQTLIPAIQLTEDGALDRPVAQLVEPLVAAGLGSWGVWSWLTAPDRRLSGDVPAKIVHEEPERALRAAQRHARELETARTLA